MNSLSSKHPLLILKELEVFFSSAASQNADSHEELVLWSGVAVKIGSFDCVIENQSISEILLPEILLNLSTVPGTKKWLTGLISLRGKTLPIVDLNKFLFDATTKMSNTSRVLVLSFDDFHCGILISKVMGLMQTTKNITKASTGESRLREERAKQYINHYIEIDNDTWPVLNIVELGQNPDFRNMAG